MKAAVKKTTAAELTATRINEVPRKRYWIQERNEYGNYFDSIGFMPEDTFEYCLKQLRGWQKEFPKRTCRLIERTDVVVAEALPPMLTLD